MMSDLDDKLMKDYSRPRSIQEYLRIYLTGFAMGAADIVPGVSGGTMAFILGIYETLLNAIKSFNLDAIRLAIGFKLAAFADHVSLRFLISLGLGIVTAILMLANLLGNLLETQPAFIFAFFGGLIVASVLAIGIKVVWNPTAILALVLGTVFAFWLVGLPALDDAGHELPVLFLSGMVAICAMILPGISGSFILLILGQYRFILDAVRNFDIVSIAAVGMGAALGIVAFSRILSWMLKHYENVTVAVLVGFMIGSLRKIWDEAVLGAAALPEFGPAQIGLAILLFIVGFIVVSLMDHLQTRDNPFIRLFVGAPSKAGVAAAD